MMGVAKLSIPGGALVMPARSPYEREIVFDNAAFYAGRQGTADLELSSPRLLIRVVKATPNDRCATCGQPGRQVAFMVGGTLQCRHCVSGKIGRSRPRHKRLFTI